MKYLPKLGTKPLPMSKEELPDGTEVDFVFVSGDAYVDHPSFGTAGIGRLLESEGYRVAGLAQPDCHSADDLAACARPIASSASSLVLASSSMVFVRA